MRYTRNSCIVACVSECLCEQDVLWWTLSRADPWLIGSSLRQAACKETFKHICYEVRCPCSCCTQGHASCIR